MRQLLRDCLIFPSSCPVVYHGRARKPIPKPNERNVKTMKLLLAEDERRMAEALLELLRQEGYDVDWFANGIEALLAAQANVYDALILDVMLPGSDGFAITSALRREGISTPILMLTARGELEDKVQGLDSGADDYLTKPFLTEELLARLRALVRRSSRMNDEAQLSGGDIVLDETTLTLRNVHTGESVRLGDQGVSHPRVLPAQSRAHTHA